MVTLIYSTIASLDGYVADEPGEFGWAAPNEQVHAFVNDLERGVGTYLYGRRASLATASTRTPQRPACSKRRGRSRSETRADCGKSKFQVRGAQATRFRLRKTEDLNPPPWEWIDFFKYLSRTDRSVHEEQHPACRFAALHPSVSFSRLL
jgi:hypothetical protein